MIPYDGNSAGPVFVSSYCVLLGLFAQLACGESPSPLLRFQRIRNHARHAPNAANTTPPTTPPTIAPTLDVELPPCPARAAVAMDDEEATTEDGPTGPVPDMEVDAFDEVKPAADEAVSPVVAAEELDGEIGVSEDEAAVDWTSVLTVDDAAGEPDEFGLRTELDLGLGLKVVELWLAAL